MKSKTHSTTIAMSISVVAMLFVIGGAFASGLLLAPSVNSEAKAAEMAPAQPVEAAQPALQTSSSTDVLAAFEDAFTDLYQDTVPSVVNIRVTKEFDTTDLQRFGFSLPNPHGEEEPNDEATPDSEGENDQQLPEEFFSQGGGSGFVWDDEGHIVTNYHVVDGATTIEVIFSDDTRVPAELVGSDPDGDVAVIKVDPTAVSLQPITIGDSEALEVGQLAIAIGSPFGQDFTLTTGIVSGVGRTIRSGNTQFSIPEVIQTDAAINPGNSGGPLLNRQGEVIGINTQIISMTGSNSGVGFAVPINIAKRIVPVIIQGDDYEYAWLGISGNTLTSEAAEFRDLDADFRGALVAEVTEDGPAAQAGLQGRNESLNASSDEFFYSGDIITTINGEPINDMNDLITYLVEETKPGDVVTLDIIHDDGSQESIKVTLGVRPSLS
ncbi:MAG: trypsin-like peptidase domain-containing protein [Anaerolineae bacterium]|nr:trypsin-like peptidase domain-containing protein [Anaerolineae bacterium]MCB0180251.1 trypsin-like peptidase domain-containing protein [Anaerolineae bacterium]MCB9105316.1 trypsin-like peptidase domain-containing protein [Anaerolineales bacterium]